MPNTIPKEKKTADNGTGFLLGTSYMTLGKSVRMWENWDSEQVRRDFTAIRGMGLNTAKIYLFWDFFFLSPEEGLNLIALSRLDELCSIARENGIQLIIDLMIGHMAGENYTASWTEGRNLMTDATALRGQAKYIYAITSHYKDEPAIAIWDVCSEISLYRLGREGRSAAYPALFDATSLGVLGEPPRQDESWLWLKTLTDAARAGDGKRPVYSGVGTARGFSLCDVAALADLNACYAYNWGNSDSCAAYLCGFERALSQSHGLPCLVEEFGTSKSWNSEAYEAGYYRTVLYTSLLNGCAGALSWQFGDYDDIENRDPYLYHAWEIRFGMVRPDGSEYACADTMREFSAFLAGGALQGMVLPQADICILLCECYDQAHAFNSAGQQSERSAYYEIYRRLRDAGLRVDFVQEDADFSSNKAIFLPAAGSMKLKSTTWRKLHTFVQNGGRLVAEADGYPGAQNFDELFGASIQMSLNYPHRTVTGVNHGKSLGTIALNGETRMVVVDAAEEDILARDEDGNPTIVMHRQNKGWTLLLTIPLQKFSARARIGAGDDLFQTVYGFIRDMMQLLPLASADRPNIETGVFISEDHGRCLLLIVNHRPCGIAEGKVTLGFSAASAWDLDTGADLTLEPDGGIHYRLHGGEVMKVMLITKRKDVGENATCG